MQVRGVTVVFSWQCSMYSTCGFLENAADDVKPGDFVCSMFFIVAQPFKISDGVVVSGHAL